jgi:LMBR1-like membrane protein
MTFVVEGGDVAGSAILLVAEILISIAVAFYFYSIFGSLKRRPWYVSSSVLLFWSVCFFIVFLIPNDVVSSQYRNCIENYRHEQQQQQQQQNSTSVAYFSSFSNETVINQSAELACNDRFVPIALSRSVLEVLWNVLYWSSFAATWLILPFLMDFAMAGQFELQWRAAESLRVNVTLYGSLGAVFGIVLLILAIEQNLGFNELAGVCISLSNAYGLIVFMLLVSFGLVQIPRKLWRKGNVGSNLRWYSWRAIRQRESLSRARARLVGSLDLLRRTASAVGVSTAADDVAEDRALQAARCKTCHGRFTEPSAGECVRSIVRKAAHYINMPNLVRSAGARRKEPVATDRKSLVRLHERTVRHVHRYQRAQVYYDKLLVKSMRLLDVEQALDELGNAASTSATDRRDGEWQVVDVDGDGWRRLNWSQAASGGGVLAARCHAEALPRCCGRLFDSAQFYWHVHAARFVWRALSVCAALLSAAIVWSEFAIFSTSVGSKPDLSVFSLMVNAGDTAGVGQMLIVLGVMLYSVACSVYAVFRIRLANYYHMVKHKMTDSRGLIFSAAFLCRLLAPIGYNILEMTRTKQGTAFSVVLSSMDDVPVLGKQFNIYLPTVLLPLVLLTMFNVFSRIAHFFKFKSVYRFDDGFEDDSIAAGRTFLLAERRRARRRRTRERSIASLQRADSDVYVNLFDVVDVEERNTNGSNSAAAEVWRFDSDDDESSSSDDERSGGAPPSGWWHRLNPWHRDVQIVGGINDGGGSNSDREQLIESRLSAPRYGASSSAPPSSPNKKPLVFEEWHDDDEDEAGDDHY